MLRVVRAHPHRATDMGEKLAPGDYIRTYLGLLGSGKTTEALKDIADRERVIILSPGTSNPMMRSYPYIYDTPAYLKDWSRWLATFPRLRVEKRAHPTPMFRLLSNLRGYTFLLDDVAALKTDPQERSEFEAFLRTVRYNGNQLVMTTHRIRKDLPPLVHSIGTSFYWVGPGTRIKRDLEALLELTNVPISYDEFSQRLENNPARTASRPAGIFPIRRVN